MTTGSIQLFTVSGISIRVHVSWLIIFALVTWSLATGFLPGAVPGISSTEAWLIGAVAALLLFVSVLLHELAHSLVALRLGLRVESITLFVFGGVSSLTAESSDPRTEFLVAIVGPLTSFVIAVGAFVVTIPLDSRPDLQAVFAYLAIVNALLGGFNLVPGFPLDGGRVFRSIMWKATGNMRRATQIASAVGQIVGYGFILLGLFRLFEGDLLDGLWTAAIGWFLQSAASSSVQDLMFQQRLRGLRVRDVLRPDDTSAPPGLTVQELLDDYVLSDSRRAVPVADNGRLVGIVTLSDLRRVPASRRRQATVAEIMGGGDGLVTTTPSSTLLEAAESLSAHDFYQLPIVEGGRVRGLLTQADIARVLQVREALGLDIPDGGRAGGAPGQAASER
ncbi:MAG TPA: site-2 protease family protein [Candidatus Saccharimonadales bacterium]|nr:site-2 protease family protein [Candidatus Saccharimonadales bacterium]